MITITQHASVSSIPGASPGGCVQLGYASGRQVTTRYDGLVNRWLDSLPALAPHSTTEAYVSGPFALATSAQL